MDSYAIYPVEVFHWVDAFRKVTQLSTIHSINLYAEICFYQHSSQMLAEMIELESQRNELIAEFDGCEDDTEAMEELESEIIEFEFEHRLCDEIFGESNIAEYHQHIENVLIHHGFKKGFIPFFIEYFSPLEEQRITIPNIELKFIFEKPYFGGPFFSEDPRDEDNIDFSDVLRMARKMHPAGWIAILKNLGIPIREGSIVEDWTLFTPSLIIEDDKVSIPVFLMPTNTSPFDVEDTLCEDLKDQVAQMVNGLAIIFWSSPTILSTDEDFSKGQSIAYWGEIFISKMWHPLMLSDKSTSITKILNDAKFIGSSLDDEKWKALAIKDDNLVAIYLKNNVDLMIEMLDASINSQH